AEIRRVSQNLMPSELQDLGLEAALLALSREFQERAGLRLTARISPFDVPVPGDLALAFFRIAQEALNNVAKHSSATDVDVALFLDGNRIVLTVKDNGVGFSGGAPWPRNAHGIGLANMRERATSVGGLLEVRSHRGEGTALRVSAPWSPLGAKAT